MDTLLLPKSYFLHSTEAYGFASDFVKVHKGSNGSNVYSGVPVFRTGTFADSTGEVTTWEPLHLESMITNGNYLAGKHIAAGWPVRDGHSTWMVGGIQGRGNTVGWTENMSTKTMKSPVDGQEYDYLLVDYSITEPYAQAKIDNGTWRNRSSEIGTYKTNDNVELAPLFMGFAYVDIPAVEGLNFSSSSGKIYVDLGGTKFQNREIPVTTPNPVLPVVPGTPAPQVQQHAAPQAPAVQASAPFSFSINGQATTDPTAVQNYVNRLEAVITESRDVARGEFVNGLVKTNKVLAPQAASYVEFAKGLDDAQYKVWQGQMDAAPPLSVVSPHVTSGGSFAGANAAPGTVNAEAQRVKDLQDQMKMHRRMGMSDENLKNTNSYKALVAAGVANP